MLSAMSQKDSATLHLIISDSEFWKEEIYAWKYLQFDIKFSEVPQTNQSLELVCVIPSIVHVCVCMIVSLNLENVPTVGLYTYLKFAFRNK